MKKLMYLILIMVMSFFSLASVNAESIQQNIEFVPNLNGAYYNSANSAFAITANINRTYDGFNFIGFTASSHTQHYLYYLTNHNFDYDILDFNIYVGNLSYVSSSNNCSANEVCFNSSFTFSPPMVTFGGNLCNVAPLGYSNYYGNSGYDYDYIYHVQCHTYTKNNSTLEIGLLNVPNNDHSVYFGVSPVWVISKSSNTTVGEINQSVKDLNQNITNDNVSGVENSFESFEGFISENSTITQLIAMPITLYSAILNGLQSTCQPFTLGNLFGTNLTLPCINISNYLGTGLWTTIDIIISGFAIFAISKKLIKIFNNFSSMKEGDVIND